MSPCRVAWLHNQDCFRSAEHGFEITGHACLRYVDILPCSAPRNHTWLSKNDAELHIAPENRGFERSFSRAVQRARRVSCRMEQDLLRCGLFVVRRKRITVIEAGNRNRELYLRSPHGRNEEMIHAESGTLSTFTARKKWRNGSCGIGNSIYVHRTEEMKKWFMRNRECDSGHIHRRNGSHIHLALYLVMLLSCKQEVRSATNLQMQSPLSVCVSKTSKNKAKNVFDF